MSASIPQVAKSSSLAARPNPERDHARIVGYDLARSLAICGMVLVHFCLAMAHDTTSPKPLAWMLHALDGRATATFVLLAGIGVALRMRLPDNGAVDPAMTANPRRKVRRALVRRGLILLAIGFVNLK